MGYGKTATKTCSHQWDSGFQKQNPDSLKWSETRNGVRGALVEAHSLILLSGLRDHYVKFGIRKNAEKRQQKPATCFARLPQNELKIDVARFTSHESSLASNNSVVGESREKFYFLNLCVLRVLPAKENLFGSK